MTHGQPDDVLQPERELQRILICGRLDEAEHLLQRLHADGASAKVRSDQEALRWIVGGIQAVLNQDTPQGIAQLERAATVSRADDLLRWVVLYWMARGAADQGELARAGRAVRESLEAAAQLSPEAHSLSLLLLADIAAREDDLEPSLKTSVALGLACIASSKHQGPAAKAKAASASFPPAMKQSDTRESPAVSPGQTMPPDGPATGRASPDVAFVGDLQLFALPDLLDFLQSSRRSGTLVITSDVGTMAVHLARGSITGAASPGATSLGHTVQRP